MKILVVDDDTIAAEIAAEALRLAGFEVSIANDGEEAWTRVSRRTADVVITDWMMPGLDGPALCRRIRDLDPDPYVYVLLVTARDEVSDVVEGLAAGADDFVRKPFRPTELVARITAVRRMKVLHDRIAEQNRQLKRAEELRRDWIHMIVHDLRNPLAVIQGSAELLRLRAQVGQEKALARIERESRRVHGMLEQMLVMAKSEAGRLKLQPEERSLGALLAEIVEGARVLAGEKAIRVELDPACDPGVAAAVDAPLWRRMVENLVGNAVKYTQRGGHVRVCVRADGDDVVVAVTDDGPGVPEADRERIFRPFEMSAAGSNLMSHGLGLAFCRLVAEAHQGRIRCVAVEPRGARFEVRHPRSAAPVGAPA